MEAIMSVLKVIVLTDGGVIDLADQIFLLKEAHQLPTQILLDTLEDGDGGGISRNRAENSCDLTLLLI